MPEGANYVRMARERGAEQAFDCWVSDHPTATHAQRWAAICNTVSAQHWAHVSPDDHDKIAERYRDTAELDTGRQALAEWRWAACRYAGTGEAHPDLLWAIRPVHGHLHQWAKARLVGPWAVLGATLARVVACVPPTVRIPPRVGSWASLNLFVGLVGPPGAGKNAAVSVSSEAIKTPDVDRVPLGSGEGISHMFMRRPRATRDNPDPELEQYRSQVLVTVGEIDGFLAVAGRRGSTLGPQIRQAAMGEQLGFFYVDLSKRMIVPEHRYRLSLIAGIQPKRSAALLTGPEADGGTPQRFVWLPVGDPAASADNLPEAPAPLEWSPPAWPAWNAGIEVCDSAREFVVSHRVDALTDKACDAEAHGPLTRLKIAAALAILDGRPEVAEDDWDLSRILWDLSETVRQGCLSVIANEASRANEVIARSQAAREGIIAEEHERKAMDRAKRSIMRQIAAHPDGVPGARLRKALASRDRQWLDPAITALLDDRAIIAVELDDRADRRGTVYRIAPTG